MFLQHNIVLRITGLDGDIKISDFVGTIQFPVSSNHGLHEGIWRVRKRLLIGQVNLPTFLN